MPCEFWLRHHLQHLDHDLLTDLLQALVAALKEEIPGLGETVAFDVKHLYAWVRENNPRVYTTGRFDVTHIPEGDPDCRLGVKKSSNQVQPDGSTTTKKEGLFGYGSGVATSTDPVYGDVVLAEFTQPFNEGDITYFRPLYDHSVLALESLSHQYHGGCGLRCVVCVPASGRAGRHRGHCPQSACPSALRTVG